MTSHKAAEDIWNQLAGSKKTNEIAKMVLDHGPLMGLVTLRRLRSWRRYSRLSLPHVVFTR